jgi:hypothetical protein
VAGLASGKSMVFGSYQGYTAVATITSTIGDVDWGSSLVITRGGTYTGNWQSTDAKTPAVTIATTQPVVIDIAQLRSVGDLIKTTVNGANITVKNSLGVALNAGAKGQPNGVFLETDSPASLDVENNYIENARGGVIVHGYSGTRDGQPTIKIQYNRARNLNGMLSDGNGGYIPANRSQARFIQFDNVQAVPGVDVAWNEVVNYAGLSLVQDNIDLYRSGGTPNEPMEIHDSYIEGAYPNDPQAVYTGGGIKTDGGDNAQEVPAFNNIHDNQVVGTVSYGIEFAAGHDNVAAHNRVVGSGLMPNGEKIAAQYVGMVNGNAAVAPSMYNNSMHDNTIGWACWHRSCAAQNYRNDQYFPASPQDYVSNAILPATQITHNTEDNEYLIWRSKTAAAGVVLGPTF